MIWHVFFRSAPAAALTLSRLRGSVRWFYWDGETLFVSPKEKEAKQVKEILENKGIIEEENT